MPITYTFFAILFCKNFRNALSKNMTINQACYNILCFCIAFDKNFLQD